MKVIVALIVALTAHAAIAQEYTFRVLVNKGQNKMRTENHWTPIKVGAALKAGDEVRIAANGYLGLVHATGKPLEVKDAGQYSIADLASKIKDSPSVLSKYTDFILSRQTEATTNLTVTGSVHRGAGDIKLFLPRASRAVFLNDEVVIAWSALPATSGYEVHFSSMFGDRLDKIEVSDTSAVLNLNTDKFREEDNIVIEVFAVDNRGKRSAPSMIKKVSPADRKRINAALEDIRQQTSDENALSALIRGAFFEEHGLFIDAGTAYRKAVEREPDVPQYREVYERFVARQSE